MTSRRAVLTIPAAAACAAALPSSVAAQGAFDLQAIAGKPLWAGPFRNENHNVFGAARLRFTFDNGKLASAQAWANMGSALYASPYDPNNDLTDYGVLKADRISYSKGGDMVLLFPKTIKITLALRGGVLKGEMDPRENPEHVRWYVVSVELKPLQP